MMFWSRDRERDNSNKDQNGMPLCGQVRVLVVGDSGVGKTSLVHLITKGQTITRPSQTIGCSVDVKHITYGSPSSSSSSITGDAERDFFVELWDISGHERYKDCRSLFYTQINGVIFVYDLSQRRTKSSLNKWATEIAATGTFSAPMGSGGPGGLPVPYIVISNKADIATKEGIRGSSGNLVDVARQWVEKQGLLPSSEELPLTESFPGNGALLAAAKEARFDKEAVMKFFRMLIRRRYLSENLPTSNPWSISPVQRSYPSSDEITSSEDQFGNHTRLNVMKYGSSSMAKKKQNVPETVLKPYEQVRTNVMEKNAQKLKELGLEQLAQQLLERLGSCSTKEKERVSKDDRWSLNLDDQDYHPDGNYDLDSDEEDSNVSKKAIDSSSKSLPNKKIRTREYAPRIAKKQPLCPALAMDKFLEMQQQVDPLEAHRLELQVEEIEQDCLRSKRQASSIVVSESEGPNIASSHKGAKRRGRGPTNMFDVHARKLEDRVTIYCNEKGQPIGPEKARKELSRFLGTIAHDYNWAPLTHTNWQSVPNKHLMWEYVNAKYILPPEAYDWVMETLDQSWRGFKCRLKRDHYYKYDNYEDRLKSCPEYIPQDHFKILLKYWASTPTKKTSLQNAKNRHEQDNMHTCMWSCAFCYDC